MKNNIVKYMRNTLPVVLLSASFAACTDNFEDVNTNPNGVPAGQVSVESRFAQPMQSIYLNYQNRDFEFQILQNLNADLYSGYLANPTPFGGNNNNSTYIMNEGWNSMPLKVGHLYVMKPISIIRSSTTLPDYLALATIIQVAAMHRVTDIYGPIPYSQAMSDKVQDIPYDSQKEVYYSFFTDLKDAVDALTAYVDENGDDPAKNRIASFDQMCGGSYIRWIRFANTLRLRLAMHIVKVEPEKAKAEAEAAVAQKYGVLTAADNDIQVIEKSLTNPLHTLCYNYNDIRVSASFISVLDGLKDPRLPKLVVPVGGYTIEGKVQDIKDKDGKSLNMIGKYIGVRQGIIIPDKNNYVMYANVNMPQEDRSSATNPLPVMKVAEAYFLRAEGVLRGWNMGGGTARSLYEDGIRESFKDLKITDATAINNYINDDVNQPADYKDPFEPKYDIAAVSRVKVKWNTVDMEKQLEQIITQKWIAMFPEGQEAWTEFRRTGYPKLFPVGENRSNGVIPEGEFVKRLKFTSDEYDTNKSEVEKAVPLLGNGATDNINTRLWWDVDKANF